MSTPTATSVLLVIIGLLIGVIVALAAWHLARESKMGKAAAVMTGGITFAGTATFVLAIMNYLGLFIH